MNICYGSYSQALHVALTLPAVQKSTGRAKVYRLCKSLPAAQTCHKSTCCTKVYRLFRPVLQNVHRLLTSLPAVHILPQLIKVYRPSTTLPGCSCPPYKPKSTGCTQVYRLSSLKVYWPLLTCSLTITFCLS